MLDLQKTRQQKDLEELLLKRLGQAPNCLYTDGHADMLVPRTNITESGMALVWLSNAISSLEEQKQFKDSDLVESLKGLYLVFRDCSLMAKHHLGFMETQVPENLRGCDLMYRFSLDTKNAGQIFMEIGSAVPVKPGKEAPNGNDD